jgi:allantoicase
MGKGDRKDAPGGAYVVIGCLNGNDDKPDLSTLRAFLATSSQGVSYNEGIWRESLSKAKTGADGRSLDEDC